MTTTVLLGAGASRDAGVPTSSELLDRISGAFIDSRLGALFGGIRGGVAMRSASASLAGLDVAPPNIEDVANAVEALIDRRRSDVSPFVASWHQLLDDMDSAEDPPKVSSKTLAGMLQRKYLDAQYQTLDTINVNWSKWAADLMRVLAKRPTTDTLLIRLRDEMPRLVAKLLGVPSAADLSYLKELFRLYASSNPLAIATLNYDTCIEGAAEDAGLAYSDGFDAWTKAEADLFGTASIRLFKLHGSLNWQRDSEDDYRRTVIDVRPEEPGIIFGGRNKLTARGPYIDLLWRWRDELKGCDQLLIVGYSFADEHVNALLVQWARLDGVKRVVVLDPCFEKNNLETAKWLKRHTSRKGDFTLSTIAKGAADGLGEAVNECLASP